MQQYYAQLVFKTFVSFLVYFLTDVELSRATQWLLLAAKYRRSIISDKTKQITPMWG